jgi:DNA polymerase-1
VYVFRAYYSLPPDMVDRDGNPVHALYGFARFMGDLIEREKPRYIAVAFDASLSTSFRNLIYPAYKANREPAPPDLVLQFERCRQYCERLGIAWFDSPEFEADDLIGTLAARMRAEGLRSTIVSRDKDLAQLITPGDVYWDYSGNARYHHGEIEGRFGVAPDRYADYLALTGDAVDNIAGVPGVGPKTATVLMRAFATLEELYERLDVVHDLPLRGAAAVVALTYGQLHAEVCKFANALKGLGIQPGDRVIIYMPMVPEARDRDASPARASAPSTRWSSAASRPRRSPTASTTPARWSSPPTAAGAAARCCRSSNRRQGAGRRLPTSHRALSCSTASTKPSTGAGPRPVVARADRASRRRLPPEPGGQRAPAVPALHLGLDRQAEGHPAHHRRLHCCGAKTFEWVFDQAATDVYWCTADCGWVTGHSYVTYGPLAAGATCVIYEGAPDFPDARTASGKIIERYKRLASSTPRPPRSARS